ncbi:MAG TPA: hypothetical protein VFZ81_16680 [Burkholderiales bacterium]
MKSETSTLDAANALKGAGPGELARFAAIASNRLAGALGVAWAVIALKSGRL